jgi:hypothetical protein
MDAAERPGLHPGLQSAAPSGLSTAIMSHPWPLAPDGVVLTSQG